MVQVQSISPEEYKLDHSSFKIVYALHPTQFGNIFIGIRDTDKAIVHLAFADKGIGPALKILEAEWPFSEFVEDTDHVTNKIVANIFSENAKLDDSISVLLKGTDFQVQVWRALIDIPRATTTTYENVAHMINKPKAIRAVANALMKNKIAYLIPCHRVMGKSGSNKYSWGVEKKEKLLLYEKEHS